MPDEKKLGFIVTAKDLATKEFKSINGEIARMEKTTKGAKTGLGGLLSTVNPTKVALFGAAAGATVLVGGLADVAQKAIQEEKNIAGLNAALDANVAGWDGNTAAIERSIAKRELLAFSDDELRGSLKLLVGATKDVDKALALQSTAMDLARFKGISLAEASEALIKIEGGQFRALKALIGSTKDIKTEQQALAAVQKVAAGAAKKYGDTTAGSMESAGIAIEDVAEDIGAELLPVIKDFAVTLRDDVIPGIRETGRVLDDVAKPVGGLGAVWDTTLQILSLGNSKTLEFANTTRRANQEAADAIAEHAEAINRNGGNIQGRLSGIEEAYRDVAYESLQTERDVRRDAKAMADHIDDWKDSVVADGKDVIDDYYDPIQTRSDLAATNAEINAQRMIIASSTATDAQIADAQRALTDLERDQGGYLLELAAAGKSGSATFQAGYNDIVTRMKTAQGSELAMLKALKRELDLLIGKVYQAQAALINLRTSAPGYYNSEKTGYASGGYVPPFGTYDVGEVGREKITMFPGGGAYVTPHSGSGSSGGGSSAARSSAPGGGGTTVVVNFHSVLPPTREQIYELTRLINEQNYSIQQRAAPTAQRV